MIRGEAGVAWRPTNQHETTFPSPLAVRARAHGIAELSHDFFLQLPKRRSLQLEAQVVPFLGTGISCLASTHTALVFSLVFFHLS